jgi:hypothetical protein
MTSSASSILFYCKAFERKQEEDNLKTRFTTGKLKEWVDECVKEKEKKVFWTPNFS